MKQRRGGSGPHPSIKRGALQEFDALASLIERREQLQLG